MGLRVNNTTEQLPLRGPGPQPGTLTVSFLCAYNHRLKLLLSGAGGASTGTILLADIIGYAKVGGPLRVLLLELQAGAPFGTWLDAFNHLKLYARVTNESVDGAVNVEPVAAGLDIALAASGDAVLELVFNHSLWF